MATYVLVHGGDRNGSIWDNVAALLTAQGHQVFCPSMICLTKTTLEHNVGEICTLIKSKKISDIILVGHSYGSMVITGVLDKLADRIAYLVYVDCVIPENGKSLYGLLLERGMDYREYGLTPDTPCIKPLYFDEKKLQLKPKVYIRCLQSEFFAATQKVYEIIMTKAESENWLCFNLDAKHGCMFTHFKELTVLLSGIQALL